MSDSLGLSIGMTNLVAARAGRPPVTRSSVLTLYGRRPAEVGLPSQNPELTSPNLTEQGLVLRGFVERVGDPVPLVAVDGSAHRGETLLAEALEAMARTVDTGAPVSNVTIAVPGHWGPGAVGALRGALRAKPALSQMGVPPTLISDAAAALAALQADPGLPQQGVIALCDFGGSGTNITLADAGANLQPIGETVRYSEFSGEQIDQALLTHVMAGIRDAGDADPAGTAAVGSLTRLRDECRQAKERLSSETATVVPVDLPGVRTDVRLTRTELESVIDAPLAGFLDELGDALERNRIPIASVAAVATVGGGAAIPLITQRLSDELRVPVITTPQPALNTAVGAALITGQTASPDAPTGMAVAADAPTGLAPAAWAAGAAGLAAGESASDGAPSATFRALAWSQDESPTDEPVPYSGEDYTFDYAQSAAGARPAMEFERHEDDDAMPAPVLVPWYRRPPTLFAAAAVAALLAFGGLAYTLTSSNGSSTTTTTSVTEPGAPSSADPGSPVAPPPPQTVTVTGSDGSPTVSTIPPPSTTTTTAPTTTTTTTTQPTTTTTTTTTTQPTTTTTTTTRTTTTTTQPTTTTAPPTTTVAPPTTTTPEIITGATRSPETVTPPIG